MPDDGSGRAAALFSESFGTDPSLVIRSPGRVNLIGDHTDYNDGFVLPMAIDRQAWLAVGPRDDRRVRATSEGFDLVEFEVDRVERGGPGWGEYVKGVVRELGGGGFDAALVSEVPVGAGLSSSAALELAVARAIAGLDGRHWHPVEAALAARRAENDWVGMACGIMDQLVVATARRGHACLIDCRSLDVAHRRLPDEVEVVVLDTGTRRRLVDSAYNERRAACEAMAAAFGVPALRDLEQADLSDPPPGLPAANLRRARHVIGENARTVAVAEALDAGEVQEAGRLMVESHASLRDDYEVSSPALDAMVEAALTAPGCLGARMTGAGFGGCAVALVERPRGGDFVEAATAAYRLATGFDPVAYPCTAVDGVSVA
jgi:galactokinase